MSRLFGMPSRDRPPGASLIHPLSHSSSRTAASLFNKPFFFALAFFIIATFAHGQGYAPLGYDAFTLHVWHLDDTTVPTDDEVIGTNNLPLQGLIGGAALSGTSLSELSTSLTCNAASSQAGFLLAAPAADIYTSSEDVPFSFADPTSGAFTYEAVVKFNSTYNPTNPGRNNNGLTMQILSMDGDGTTDRIFQFRFIGGSGPPNNFTPPTIQFINLAAGGTVQTLSATVPITGANAVNNTNWFHVAVTYNGLANTANDLSFYWTKLITSNTTSNLIGTATMTAGLPANAGSFTVGGRSRSGGTTDGFEGNIDEIRISGTARPANGMMPSNYDTDGTGMPDWWQLYYFGKIGVSGTSDPDGSGYTVLQDYAGGADPTNPNSLPLGVSGSTASTLPVITSGASVTGFYGSALSYQIAATNSPTSYNATSLPSGLSVSSTTGLISGAPTQTGTFNATVTAINASGTGSAGLTITVITAAVTSGSTGVVTTYYPLYDGSDQASSGYAYAGSSAINDVSFICSNLMTVGNQQFIAYYGRHQTSSSYAYNNTIWVARRTLGATVWQVYRTAFTANDITDGHDVVSFGIDGAGYMHMSWGMHNAIGTAYHYTRSTAPVTGTDPIAFAADAHNMTGNEYEVTYPQFFTLPNGDLLYLYRVGGAGGGSGDGNTFWNYYTVATQTWTNVPLSGTTPVPVIDGEDYSYNGYPNMTCMDPKTGKLFMTWTWRYTPAFETNENMAYAESSDLGQTWQRMDGTTYSLGVAEKYVSGITTNLNTIAQQVLTISGSSSLMNQAGMCLDSNGVPVIGTWWAPGAFSTNTGSTGSGNNERQYMIAYPTTTGTAIWATRQISNRNLDPPSFFDSSATYVRDLGRPVMVCDAQGRLLMLYRDNHASGGLTVAYSETPADDSTRTVWNTIDLTGDNLGGYEPTIDFQRWQRDNILDVVYQPSDYVAYNGLTYSAPANTASQIGVLEWNEAAYFATPTLNMAPSGQNEVLSYKSILGSSYRLWTSTDLVNWTAINTSVGDGTVQSYTHTGGAVGAKRFWRLQVAEGTFQ